jgi:hypothetical protein
VAVSTHDRRIHLSAIRFDALLQLGVAEIMAD